MNMRSKGVTYRNIGLLLNISDGRVRQIYYKAKRIREKVLCWVEKGIIDSFDRLEPK